MYISHLTLGYKFVNIEQDTNNFKHNLNQPQTDLNDSYVKMFTGVCLFAPRTLNIKD